MRLRAVIFDYGEVLSAPANAQAHQELIQIAGLDEEVFDRQYWAWRLDYDAARLNGRSYWEKIGQQAGVRFTPDQIRRLIECDTRMWMDLNQPMLAWTAELKRAGLAIGILSNMGEDTLRAMRLRFAWLNDFDSLTFSCELGVVKPDSAIYRDPIEKLGIAAGEALFIDNLGENVAGAENAGMQGILFEGIEQLESELRRRQLRIPLPGSRPEAAARSLSLEF